MLKNELHDILLGLVYSWDSDPRARRILKIIQEYVSNEKLNQLPKTKVQELSFHVFAYFRLLKTVPYGENIPNHIKLSSEFLMKSLGWNKSN